MTAVGGSPQECSVSGRIFAVASDSGAPRKLGGKENEFQMNGDGATGRYIKKAVGWKITLKLSIDDDLGDLEYLQDLVDANEPFPFNYTEASGLTYGNSTAQITSELQRDGESATAEVTFEGPGRLELQ